MSLGDAQYAQDFLNNDKLQRYWNTGLLEESLETLNSQGFTPGHIMRTGTDVLGLANLSQALAEYHQYVEKGK